MGPQLHFWRLQSKFHLSVQRERLHFAPVINPRQLCFERHNYHVGDGDFEVP